jgi:hypothetical protein
VLNRYGAKDPAELFAVATETFFERPRQFWTEHPEMYALLEQTPISWNGVTGVADAVGGVLGRDGA